MTNRARLNKMVVIAGKDKGSGMDAHLPHDLMGNMEGDEGYENERQKRDTDNTSAQVNEMK